MGGRGKDDSMVSGGHDVEGARHRGHSDVTWRIVIPFKGTARAKSRLAERFDPPARAALAMAMLRDTVSAVRKTPFVGGLVVVCHDPNLPSLLADGERLEQRSARVPVTVLPDPGAGLNGAISAGISSARADDAGAHVAVVLGDLPALRPEDLAAALELARGHSLAFVADAATTGTTMITVSPGIPVEPRFGTGSAAAHVASGFAALELPASSGLRRDVDAPGDLDMLLQLGAFTRAALAGP
jgi:2-phospho-L-lactate guanylyltransferase